MARKSTKTKKRKKTASTRKATRGKQKQKHYSPLSVLVIMGLITVIVIMFNNFHAKNKKNSIVKQESSEGLVTVLSPDQVIPARATKQKNKQNDQQKKDKAVKADMPEARPSAKPAPKAQIQNKTIKVYYLRFNEKNEQISYVPVRRTIQGGTQFENTLKSLIHGLKASEKQKGYISTLPSNLRVRGINFRNGIVTIDFNHAFAYNAVGDILVSRINQIFLTVTQFSQVKGVVLKVNGRLLDAIDGDGRHFNWPMRRRL